MLDDFVAENTKERCAVSPLTLATTESSAPAADMKPYGSCHATPPFAPTPPLMFGPNIIGSANFNSGTELTMASSLRGGSTGAFSSSNAVANGYSPGSSQSGTYRTLGLNLQNGNSIYSGTKMQVQAIQLLPCIKC